MSSKSDDRSHRDVSLLKDGHKYVVTHDGGDPIYYWNWDNIARYHKETKDKQAYFELLDDRDDEHRSLDRVTGWLPLVPALYACKEDKDHKCLVCGNDVKGVYKPWNMCDPPTCSCEMPQVFRPALCSVECLRVWETDLKDKVLKQLIEKVTDAR